MSVIDDLRTAGFSQEEVSKYAAEQRSALLAGGFSAKEADDYLGVQQPDAVSAGHTFARVLGQAWKHVNAGAEAAANTAAGVIGFTTGLVGAPISVAHQYLRGEAEPEGVEQAIGRIAGAFTTPLYEESTDLGQKYTDAVGEMVNQIFLPLAGLNLHVGKPVTPKLSFAAAESIQKLPVPIKEELARKLTGQVINADDFRNAATIAAEAKPEAAAAAEQSLRATHEKTGIGPYSVLEAAKTEPTILRDLTDPNVEVPKAIEPYIEKFPETTPTPGDGLPLLDTTTGREATAETLPPEARDFPTEEAQAAIDEKARAADEAAQASVEQEWAQKQADLVDVRKRESVLQTLLECLA